MKRIKWSVLFLIICLLSGCASGNTQVDEVNVESETENKEVVKEEDKNSVIIEWEDGEPPTEVGDKNSYAKFVEARVMESAYSGTILVMDFEYTNTTSDAQNFINDSSCSIRPYQNGIELDSTGWMDESGLYDCESSFTDIKDGATIDTQLVWVLRDTVNPVEIEFGYNEDYDPAYVKILQLSGGDVNSAELEEDNEKLKSDYTVDWESENPPKEIGGSESYARIEDVAVVDWTNDSALLIINFEYTNDSEDAKNFINDIFCEVKPYQNGIELDSPGVTSESGVYNFTDAYTSIKKGATIKTQLVWILQDTISPIEIELGLDENYDPAYVENLIFK